MVKTEFFKLSIAKVIFGLIIVLILELLSFSNGAHLFSSCPVCLESDWENGTCPTCHNYSSGFIYAGISLIPFILITYLVVCFIFYRRLCQFYPWLSLRHRS